MRAFHEAAAELYRRGKNSRRVQIFDAESRSDDVDDGVDCPYFVEVDLVDGALVHGAFGCSDEAEYPDGVALDPV